MSCAAPNEAAALALFESFDSYFRGPHSAYLRAPWAPTEGISEEQLETEQRARFTYQKLLLSENLNVRRPQYRELTKKLTKAYETKNESKIEMVQREMEQWREAMTRQACERLQASGNPRIDPQTVISYLRKPKGVHDPDVYLKWEAELARRMGQLPLADGKPVDGSDNLSTFGGTVKRAGLQIDFEHLFFRRIDLGLPALAKHLCTHGCSDIRYALPGLGEDTQFPPSSTKR